MGKLESLAAALLGTLEEARIPAALAGGMAANAWVDKEDVHLTYDVDVAILLPGDTPFSADSIAESVESRSGMGCFHGSDLELPKARIIRLVTRPDGTVIDLVLADGAYTAAALARTGSVDLAGVARAILAPEDVLLFKSLAARDKDRIAIAALAKAQALDMAYVEKWSRHLGTWTFVSSVLGRAGGSA